MNLDSIKISRIFNQVTSDPKDATYAVCWIQNEKAGIEIDGVQYEDISNSVFFFHQNLRWKVNTYQSSISSGFILYLPTNVMENPMFKNLHITEIRLFKTDEIPKINLSPGIEKRVRSILEMLDELISTNLKHREDAILSLLKTLFVYCDGQCNIKSVINKKNPKSALVYKFKKEIDRKLTEYQKVEEYARLLNISSKYLNECVKEILGYNAKSLIDEQLIMRARHELKFTDKTIKEISFDLGFSSPEYFSYFYKKHTGTTPSQISKR